LNNRSGTWVVSIAEIRLARVAAFTDGIYPGTEIIWQLFRGRHKNLRHKMDAVRIGGRAARPIYRLLRHFPETGLSLMLLTLITGRTHQARVHMAALGCPVLADKVYSRGTGDLVRKHPGLAPFCGRQMLHARRLTLKHPDTGRLLTFWAPWPPDFLGLWRKLSLGSGQPLAIP
jgi:23S rRNA-/tRNA-specific pseudouridylate synthase